MKIEPRYKVPVLYEDDAILVVSKPAGLVSVSDGYDTSNQHLVSVLEPAYGELWNVHRLDRETSGVVVLARTELAHRSLSIQFEERDVAKVYHAIVNGHPAWSERSISAPLRADADRWMDWCTSTLWPAFRPVFLNLVRTPAEKRNQKEIDEGARNTGAMLARLDSCLEGRKFVAGDELTMGDIAFGPIVYLVQNVPFERPKLANYDAWYARLSERPAFRKIVALPIA